METLKLKDISFEYKCEVVAQVAHTANRQYSECIGGRPVNPTWEQLTQAAKESLIEAIAETIRNPKTPAESHEAWCLAKKAQGWKHDVRLDQNRKTHPNLVPFAELPFEEQLKDGLFLGIISIFVSALGIKSIPHEFDELIDEEPLPAVVAATANEQIITTVEEFILAERYDDAYDLIGSLDDREVIICSFATLDTLITKLNPVGGSKNQTPKDLEGAGLPETSEVPVCDGSEDLAKDIESADTPLPEIPEDGTTADLSKDEGTEDVRVYGIPSAKDEGTGDIKTASDEKQEPVEEAKKLTRKANKK